MTLFTAQSEVRKPVLVALTAVMHMSQWIVHRAAAGWRGVDWRKVEIVVDTRTEARSLRVTDLRDLLVRLTGRHRVPGAQLAIHHHGETVTAEFGELEHRSGRPVTRDSAFQVGSITKTFTATVAMILVADGDLELDLPLGEQAPELADFDELGVTLRHILSHTAGLPAGPDTEDVRGASLRRYVVDHCLRHPLLFLPGTAFSYSNAAYVLAGRLIEVATGMTWAEAVGSILLQPLGINPAFVACSGAPPVPASGRPMATGHSVNPTVGRTRPVRPSLAAAEAPAGALAVSAADLIALSLLHIGQGAPRLLPAAYAEVMRTPARGADGFGLADGWGLGLAVFGGGVDQSIGHDGNADGTSCYFRASVAGEWAVALTSNAGTGAGLWRDVCDELAGSGIPVGAAGQPGFARQRPALSGCAGSYLNGDTEFVVAERDGSLSLAVDGDPPAPMTLHEDLTFALVDPASGRPVLAGRFGREADTGAIDRIQLSGRLARRRSHLSDARRRLIA